MHGLLYQSEMVDGLLTSGRLGRSQDRRPNSDLKHNLTFQIPDPDLNPPSIRSDSERISEQIDLGVDGIKNFLSSLKNLDMLSERIPYYCNTPPKWRASSCIC